MNLIRQYKLWKLGVPVDSKILEVFEFVESKISNLQTFEIAEYPEFVFFMNSEKQEILEFEIKKRHVRVRYSDFWGVLQIKYKIAYYDIQKFIHAIVEDMYKLNIYTTDFGFSFGFVNVEEAYTRKFGTKAEKIKIRWKRFTKKLKYRMLAL